jgi:hypothetical protein
VAMYGSFSYHLVTAEIEPKWINANIPSQLSTFQPTFCSEFFRGKENNYYQHRHSIGSILVESFLKM